MSSRRWQRGEGKAGIIFWLLIFVVAGIVAKEWIPAKIKDMQLRDHMDEMAKLYPRGDKKFFTEEIIRRAKDLDITLTRQNVSVEKNQRRVRMKVEYVKTLDFIVTTFDLAFSHDMERDIFLM